MVGRWYCWLFCLGCNIVLVFCLVFLMYGFGWCDIWVCWYRWCVLVSCDCSGLWIYFWLGFWWWWVWWRDCLFCIFLLAVRFFWLLVVWKRVGCWLYCVWYWLLYVCLCCVIVVLLLVSVIDVWGLVLGWLGDWLLWRLFGCVRVCLFWDGWWCWRCRRIIVDCCNWFWFCGKICCCYWLLVFCNWVYLVVCWLGLLCVWVWVRWILLYWYMVWNCGYIVLCRCCWIGWDR